MLKVEWVKVSLNDKVKRIYNPSKDVKCLANQIKSHFKELSGYSLVFEAAPKDKEFALQWSPSLDLTYLLTSNELLEEIYLTHGLQKERKVLRFEILINPEFLPLSESFRNSEIRGSQALLKSEIDEKILNQSNNLRSS